MLFVPLKEQRESSEYERFAEDLARLYDNDGLENFNV